MCGAASDVHSLFTQRALLFSSCANRAEDLVRRERPDIQEAAIVALAFP
jgi:hypothetical protein